MKNKYTNKTHRSGRRPSKRQRFEGQILAKGEADVQRSLPIVQTISGVEDVVKVGAPIDGLRTY